MSSSAPCSSHSLHVKVTQVGKPSGDKTGKNDIWSGKLVPGEAGGKDRYDDVYTYV